MYLCDFFVILVISYDVCDSKDALRLLSHKAVFTISVNMFNQLQSLSSRYIIKCKRVL